jgi:hypothetical protein
VAVRDRVVEKEAQAVCIQAVEAKEDMLWRDGTVGRLSS